MRRASEAAAPHPPRCPAIKRRGRIAYTVTTILDKKRLKNNNISNPCDRSDFPNLVRLSAEERELPASNDTKTARQLELPRCRTLQNRRYGRSLIKIFAL